MRAVRVEIVTYAPTAFFHCQHCEIAFQQLGIGAQVRRDELDEALPVDLQFEYLDLSEWVHELVERHGPGVDLRVIDAASVAGVWTSLRRGVRAYPAVIVEGRIKRVGTGFRDLDPAIDRLVAQGEGRASNESEGGTTT